MTRKTVLIIGAGPAGLTAAYELLNKSNKYEVVILEKTSSIGGISRTVNYKGNRMDIGGHRFFSKIPEINDWWEKMLPIQGKPSYDDLKLKRKPSLKKGGPNPETNDDVMLRRNRLSRIFFNQKFFDYPITLKVSTIKNLGIGTTFLVGCSYLKSLICKRPENSLEDFYINRFGKKLYSLFFENYTENLWGKHPRDISPEWGAQRVKGLSIIAIIKDITTKTFKNKRHEVETSLIEKFTYPKFGPGQLWETVAKKIEKLGGEIIMNAEVIKLKKVQDNSIESVTYRKNGKTITKKGDYIVSSMAIKNLVSAINDTPNNVLEIAKGLPYRDYITIGVLCKRIKLKNNTKIKTLGDYPPDNWIYVHDKNVKMGRIQIYNNWSPYLVKDPRRCIWLGLEYFCNENDKLWSLNKVDFKKLAIKELLKLNIIETEQDVEDYHIEKIKKAYPAYFGTYSQFDELRSYLDKIPNLFCIGRNGQHRYNNMDHSMFTSFEAVKDILNNKTDKSNIWDVNTEQEYHEQ